MTFSLFASLLALIVFAILVYTLAAMFLMRYSIKYASANQLSVFNQMMDDAEEREADEIDKLDRLI